MNPEQRVRCFLDKLAERLNYKNHRIEINKIPTGGANFTSGIFFCDLSGAGEPDLKLFVKSAILSDELRSAIRFDIFNTENLFFSELVPRYKKLEDKYNVPEEERLLLPKYYGGSRDYLNEILVLENLAAVGFQDFDRITCFDWDYASKCIEQLAILHSLSIAYAEKNRKEFEGLTETLQYGYAARHLKKYHDSCVALSVKTCHENNKERLIQFLRNTINDETFEKFSKSERRPGLIHGDFRPSNIMHKIDKNGKLQIIILDHQVTQRGNPLSDLMYYIISGSDSSFRAKYFFKLLDHYYDVLSRSLSRLDVNPEKVYPKENFDSDVKLFLPYGLMLAVMLLPAVTLDDSNMNSANDFLDGKISLEDSNSNYSQRLNDMINDFIEMGVL